MLKSKQKINEVDASQFIKSEIQELYTIIENGNKTLTAFFESLDISNSKLAGHIIDNISRIFDQNLDEFGSFDYTNIQKLSKQLQSVAESLGDEDTQKYGIILKFRKIYEWMDDGGNVHNDYDFKDLEKYKQKFIEWTNQNFMPKYKELISFINQQTGNTNENMQKNNTQKRKLNEINSIDFAQSEWNDMVQVIAKQMQSNRAYYDNYLTPPHSKVLKPAGKIDSLVTGSQFKIEDHPSYTLYETLMVRDVYYMLAQFKFTENSTLGNNNFKNAVKLLNKGYMMLKRGVESPSISNSLKSIKVENDAMYANAIKFIKQHSQWIENEFKPKVDELTSFLSKQSKSMLGGIINKFTRNENMQQESTMKITAKDLKKVIRENKSSEKQTITVKNLKQKLTEAATTAKLGLGFGFKNQPLITTPNKTKPLNCKKKKSKKQKNNYPYQYIDSQGTAMLGTGFAVQEALRKYQNNPAKLAALVEGMVRELKGKSDYTNLRFVDNVAKKYHVNEATIKTMKKIIRESKSVKTAIRLHDYITECACEQSQDVYGQYNGLQTPSTAMLPNIKRTFNKYQTSMPSPQEAMTSTASQLGIPMEMVEEMYAIQKEAKKLKLEGQGGNFVATDEKLGNIYEKYQKMSEGDMFEMYDEMADYMDYPSSDDIAMHSSGIEPLSELDDSLVSHADDDRGLSLKQKMAQMQRNIDAEPDDYWAYGKHSNSDTDSEFDSDLDLDDNLGLDGNIDSEGDFDFGLEDDEPIDIHRYDNAFDDFDGDEDDIWADDEIDLDESDDILIDEDFEGQNHQISAMNPRNGEMVEYTVDVTDNGYMVEGGDDIRYVNINNGTLVGGEDLPEEVRQHIWTMYESSDSNEMSLDDEESFKAERMNPDGQFERDWSF